LKILINNGLKNMNRYYQKVFLLTLLFLFSNLIYSQGKLTGTVIDSISTHTLVGANLIVLGTSTGAASNIDGEYRITGIPEGDQILRISYIGYKSKEINVIIVKDRTLKIDITLTPDILESEVVFISAQAAGQVAAINQQLSSNTIINVVSEEKIQELPDANAAEAIGRLPGVSIQRSGGEANKITLRGLGDQYTNITLDGVQLASTDATGRGIDLSMISQGSLAGIEMFKALTSDKDADAIAGSVNLVTKKAPAERLITVTARGSYNDLDESMDQYDFTMRYGERFFDNLLGVQLSGNIENKIRSNERKRVGYDRTRFGGDLNWVFVNQFELEYTDEQRERQGIGAILDFDTPDGGNIKFNNQYYATQRDFVTHMRDYPNGGGNSQYGSGVTYTFRDREQDLQTLSSALTGKNHLFDFDINWGISYAESISDYPYDYMMEFAEGSILGEAGMKALPEDLEDAEVIDNPEILIDYAYNNFRSATLGGAFYRTQNNFDKNKSIFVDLLREYRITNNITGNVKFGGKYKVKTKRNRETLSYGPYYVNKWRPYNLLADGSTVAKDLTGTSFEDFYNAYLENPSFNLPSFSSFLDDDPKHREVFNELDLYPIIDRDLLREWYALNKDGIGQTGLSIQKEYLDVGSVKVDDYNISEAVTSFYVMNTLNFGQDLILLAGLRMEQENNDYENKYSFKKYDSFPASDFQLNDTTSSYSETIWLPNIQLNYKATDFMNVRLAAYRALARPNFNMRLNSFVAFASPFSDGSERDLIIGNPKLKTAKAWNFEVNTSFYGNEIGLISLSVFYKRIDDMYHMLNGFATQDTTLLRTMGLDTDPLYNAAQTYELTVPYNSQDPSHVWGLEFEHQMNLTFLPGFLGNFIVSYNASFVKSETSLIGGVIDTTYSTVEILPGVFIQNPEYSVRAVKSTKKLENQPELFGNVALGYDDGTFSARLSLFHQEEYFDSYNPQGISNDLHSSYTKLDFIIKYKFTDYLSMQLNVNNLTDVNEENFIDDEFNDYRLLRDSEQYGTTAELGIRIDL
jgi:TonB-dependent receptor